MLNSNALRQRWWMHRDQKVRYDADRDAAHVRDHPGAFEMKRCYQSSLYLTDCEGEEDDAFICCPGSHAWEDGDGWISSGDGHHVSVPHADPRVRAAISKLVVKRGEMILWDSRLAHMGGYVAKSSSRSSGGMPVKMLRLRPFEPAETEGARAALEKDGVCLVRVASEEEMTRLETLLCEDVSRIYDLPAAAAWNEYPERVYGRREKGGGSWGAIACGRAAWEARLLPERVRVFRDLLGTDDIVVSVDSVHWNDRRARLSFMASFCPRTSRSEEAFKRKCVAQAYGLARTTHWAALGDVSKFNYGGEHNKVPQTRYESVSRRWRGHGAVSAPPPDIRKVYVKRLPREIYSRANAMTVEEAEALLDPCVSRWL